MIIYLGCISKQNSNNERQIILVIILNKKGWNYVAVKIYLHCQDE